ncbi:MAG: carbohydrate binding family 9 domain-containing protein [FCB group bacterium]|nr:carbohydrate binding family 9 domain-containing protein [FCB group bacterium]
MRRLPYLLLLITLLWGVDSTFDPEAYKYREVIAHRLEHPLKIDGLLTEPLYDTTPNQTFIQVDPDNGKPASESTQVWVGYDDNALYIGARLWDSQPDSIIGRMGRRDNDTNSDLFQVAIDSYHDKRSGYFFLINPSGAIQDGTIANDSWFDNTWDGVWDSKAVIDDQGWTVEMRIPYSQLRFSKQDEYVWGIGFGRIIKRKNEQAFFTYFPRGESGIVSRFAVLKGITDITPPKRTEFLPYFTSGYSLLPSLKDNPFYKGKDTKLNIGTDMKLGIGNNITIDATINPDFGQVEVDPSVINLSAYETYYEEKRPFFVEGANIFSFGKGGPSNRWGFNFSEPNFFYSRRIGRPPQGWVATNGWVDKPQTTSILGAAKISGKLNGDWSIGGLSALTKREYARVNEDGNIREEEIEPLTSYNLLRTQKEFNKGLQGLGLLSTYVRRNFKREALRDILSDNAFAFGADGWTFLNNERDWVIAGWLGFTEVSGTKTRMLSLQQNSSHYFQRPDANHVAIDSSMTKMRGFAGRMIVNKEKGHFTFNTGLGIISPGFESNDLGLNFGTDRINKHLVLGYKWYDPGKIFRYSAINLAYSSNHNFGGVKINEMFFLFGYAQLLNYWSFNGFMGLGPETLSDTKLRGGPMVISPSGWFSNLNIRSDNRKDIIFGVGSSFGGGENGDWSRSFWGWVEFKLGTRLSFNVNPNYSQSKSVDQYVMSVIDKTAETMYGKRYIVAQINQTVLSSDIRIDYTFTPTLSLQAYFQPFIAVGKYSDFKEFKAPETYDFLVYGEAEGTSITPEGSGYTVVPGENSESFFLYNPDFNYKALVGNAVLRWEFKPGSTLYLVWTRNGSDFQNPGDFKLRRDLRYLMKAKSDNVLALKISYWIGR